MADIPICYKVKSEAGGFTGPWLGFTMAPHFGVSSLTTFDLIMVRK